MQSTRICMTIFKIFTFLFFAENEKLPWELEKRFSGSTKYKYIYIIIYSCANIKHMIGTNFHD